MILEGGAVNVLNGHPMHEEWRENQSWMKQRKFSAEGNSGKFNILLLGIVIEQCIILLAGLKCIVILVSLIILYFLPLFGAISGGGGGRGVLLMIPEI